MQVTVPPETIAEFKALKTRRKYRFMTLKIDPTAFTVSVDKSAPASATGADFLKVRGLGSARNCTPAVNSFSGQDWTTVTLILRLFSNGCILQALPGTNARYCIYDHEYKTKDGRTTDKLFFILWCGPCAVISAWNSAAWPPSLGNVCTYVCQWLQPQCR
jgi:hypothetical protein